MRRALLRLLGFGAFTVPGLGGQQGPGQFSAPAQQTAPGIQPGVSQNVIRARQVIVSGTADGVFVYSGTPGPGNPPIAAMTGGDVDPYGNTVYPDISSVGASGLIYMAAGLLNIALNASQYAPAEIFAGATEATLNLNSGLASSGDTLAELALLSATANGGGSLISMTANEVSMSHALNVATEINVGGLVISSGSVGLGMATPTDYPANTSAEAITCLNSLIFNMITAGLIS
jgi:hypothetical protein